MTLTEARERKYLTQEELSQLVGLTQATLSRIENGRVSPRLKTRRRLAEALNVHPDQIDWPDVPPAELVSGEPVTGQ